MKRMLASALLAAVTLGAPRAEAAEEGPTPRPSLLWLALQAVPSPEVAAGRDGAAFGLRWQVTPILWSFGLHRSLWRWRSFVVEPLTRQSGSVALDVCGEYLWGFADRFLVRPGVHATFPILERGEYLSLSIGTSTFRYDDTWRAAFDGGIYALYGLLGVELSVAPGSDALRAVAGVRVRYF